MLFSLTVCDDLFFAETVPFLDNIHYPFSLQFPNEKQNTQIKHKINGILSVDFNSNLIRYG